MLVNGDMFKIKAYYQFYIILARLEGYKPAPDDAVLAREYYISPNGAVSNR